MLIPVKYKSRYSDKNSWVSSVLLTEPYCTPADDEHRENYITANAAACFWFQLSTLVFAPFNFYMAHRLRNVKCLSQ